MSPSLSLSIFSGNRVAQELLMSYSELNTMLNEKVQLARIDCFEEEELMDKYGILELPTIKLLQRNRADLVYRGPLELHRIAKWTLRQIDEEKYVRFVDTFEELRVIRRLHEVVVVGLFSHNTTKEYELFVHTATTLSSQYYFVVIFNNSIFKNANITEGSSLWKDNQNLYFTASNSQHSATIIIMTRRENFTLTNSQKPLFYSTIKSFILQHGKRLVHYVDPSNIMPLLENGLPSLLILIDTDLIQTTKEHYRHDLYHPEFLGPLYDIAYHFENQLNFLFTDGRKYVSLKKRLGFINIDGHCAAIIDVQRGCHYNFPQNQTLTQENLLQFCEDYFAKKLKPYRRSEKPPYSYPYIITLYTDNFQEVVLNTKKSVLVYYTLPWCGFCKRLWPIFVKMADVVYHNQTLKSKIELAWMDCHLNDPPLHEHIVIDKYPTLLLYPIQNKNSPIMYHGSDTFDELISFVNINIDTRSSSSSFYPAQLHEKHQNALLFLSSETADQTILKNTKQDIVT